MSEPSMAPWKADTSSAGSPERCMSRQIRLIMARVPTCVGSHLIRTPVLPQARRRRTWSSALAPSITEPARRSSVSPDGQTFAFTYC